MEGFSISNTEIWHDVDCMIQTEMECGPRLIWAMALICIGRRHHIPFPIILDKFHTLGNISQD